MNADDPTTPPDPDDPQLAELAGKILEGERVDWSTTAGAASPYLDELKALDALARLARESAMPTEWGHLKLLECVGEGSSGRVFRAWDTRLDREVALKLLRPSETPQAIGTTTIDEGRLLARVRHPNVVTVYGAERIDGLVGIWTEFVHGETLAALVRRTGVLSAERACEIGATLCSALSAIHHAGVVHGDVKAQNVLVEPDGRVVLVDLGTGGEHAMDVGGSGSRPISGTPLYMAPELWSHERPTSRSDIYSLGVLLYFLVTAKYPVRGTTVEEIREAHANSQRVALSDNRVALTARFVDAVERALSADRESRFASADDFQVALKRASSTFAKARRDTTIVAASAVAVLAGLIALVWIWTRPPSIAITSTARLQLLTHNSRDRPILVPAISPDGRRLALADAAGVQIETIDPPDVHPVPLPPDVVGITDLGWLADSSTLLTATAQGIWRTTWNGETTRISPIGGVFSVSPDGRYLAVNPGGRIVVMTTSGEGTNEIVPTNEMRGFGRPTWSPDSSRVAYRKTIGSQRIGIASRPREGGAETIAVEVTGLFFLTWAADGKILYSSPQPQGGRVADLWAIAVDSKSGARIGDSVDVERGENLTFSSPSITRDGRQLVFLNNAFESHVAVASFDPSRAEMGQPRQISWMSNVELPTSWAREEVLFNAGGLIYAQDPDKSTPHLLMPSLGKTIDAAVSPDERWLLFVRPAENALMRVPASGSPRPPDAASAQKLFDVVGYTNDRIRCVHPAHPLCAVGTRPANGAETQILTFDPDEGQPTEHAILPSAVWDLSPDGTEIVGLDARSALGGSVVVLNLKANFLSYIATPAIKDAGGVAWAGSANGWIVTKSDGVAGHVWYVDRSGNTKVLPGNEYMALSHPVVSADGRSIAFARASNDGNVWMLQRF